jgi:hypothetical protein
VHVAYITGSTGKNDDMVIALELQLDIVNKVILATYHAWTTPRRDSWASDTVSEIGMLFGSIVSQLFQPLWILFRQMLQQQEDVGGSRRDEKSIRILLRGKNIMPSAPVVPLL